MARRGGGDGNVRQRKDGRWEARLRYIDPITGYSGRLSFYGAARSDVVTQLDEARARMRRRKSPRAEGILLADFLETWIDDVVKPTMRAWTHRSYASIVTNHLAPSRLGRTSLRDLRDSQIQHVLVAKSKATIRTQQLCLIVLRRALEQAVKWQLIDENPAVGIRPPRTVKRELRVLNPEEARAFLAAAEGDRLYALYYLAVDTGMRQGELFALRWSDVDFEGGYLRVVRAINTATGEIGPPKTKHSRRRIELGMRARAVLLAHKKRMRAEGHSGPLVFPSTRGAPLSPSNVRVNSFLPAQKKAKIDPPVRFHDLRHTAATLMLGAGVHTKIASERLGHASIAITMDTYQHVSPSMQRGAADVMTEVLAPKTKRKGVKRGGQRRSKSTPKNAEKPS